MGPSEGHILPSAADSLGEPEKAIAATCIANCAIAKTRTDCMPYFFTVDTHLFRELGELLVGRDSTALVELIKNSYDADATVVTVEGRHLDDPKRGRILILDDGIGMNAK